ncbi:MAG TPA: hypothetical protein VGM29_07795 [Polyangiaceae bacterium]|jgi:hypothetical protein
MRLFCRVAIFALCLGSAGALSVACDVQSTAADLPAGSAGFGSPDADAGADAADAEPVPDSLAFDPQGTLTLEPKATRELSVVATPPGNFLVRFALTGSNPDVAASDAALDTNDALTDQNGVAHVTLTAPSTPMMFDVRASVAGEVPTLLGVSIVARDQTTLRVIPSYNGKRPIQTWTATAESGSTCADLTGNPPPDGAIQVTVAAGQELTLEHLPTGIALAVTVRAGHYIGGCADQSALSESDGNQILVFAADRPVDLAATDLALSFGPSDANPALSKLLSSVADQASAALGGSAMNDVNALLDAMHDVTPVANRDDFSTTRTARAWDAALSTAFGSGASTRLRTPAASWMNAGLNAFFSADAFAGELSSLSAGALFSLHSVAGVPAASAGFPTTFQATWSADSNDVVLIGTKLSFVPSRLVTALAAAPAVAEFPQTTSAAAALAESVNCSLVAQTLLAHGVVVGSDSYMGCAQACTETACQNAVTALWQNASNSSGSTSANLSFTGTSSAVVADDASIATLSGSWVGELQLGSETSTASGALGATSEN